MQTIAHNDLQKIHNTSLRILENVGIKLWHPDILNLLKKRGIKVRDNIAFFKPDQIEKLLELAPEQFTLHAKNPLYDNLISGETRTYAAGYGSSEIIEKDGTRRCSKFRDHINFLKLIQQLPDFKLTGGILSQPTDIKAEHSAIAMVYASMLCSDKCLIGVPSSFPIISKIMDLAGIFFEGHKNFIQKPHVLTLISLLSPLQISNESLDSMLVCAKHNQPMILTPGIIAGATGPISIAGSIALGNAEILASIAIIELINPGTPVVYGLQVNAIDMRTAFPATASPLNAIAVGYSSQLAKMYNLPSRGSGTCNQAKIVSEQSSYESMMAFFSACIQEKNLILHSAGTLDNYAAMSYEKFIIDIEIIRMVECFMKGITIDDESLSFDIIKQIDPAGQFITHHDTLEKCRSHTWTSMLQAYGKNNNLSLEKEYKKQISDKLDLLFSSYQKPKLDKKISQQLEKYLTASGIDITYLNNFF